MKSLTERINESIIFEKLNLDRIPLDASVNDEPEEYEGEPKYRKYLYFGDCKNTIDVDHMWDATQMGQWIYNNCKITSPLYVLDKIENGDRVFPKKAQKLIDKLRKQNKLEDTEEIVCGLDDYQKIMFIYLTDFDTHYFFDCIK